ncbi:MAG: amino acid permease [Chlamydiales bacterium]
MISKNNRLVGAILLVSGTTIGAAMLALPVTTGLGGLGPSIAIMTVVWLFMLLTAFYLLEVNLRMKGESNIISMVGKTLGRWGQIVSWLIYLLLLYSLIAAYMVGCSQILSDLFDPILTLTLPGWIWPVILFVCFSCFIYFGTEAVDCINRPLMVGLAITFLSLIFMGLPHVKPALLQHVDWQHLLPSLAVVATTFGFHIIIPTLTTYLEHDTRLLKRALFIGSLIPYILYVIWAILVMGIIPVIGSPSLNEAAATGMQVTFALKLILNNRWIGMATRGFALFAIITSLLGVSLSLSDFLADGFRIEKRSWGKPLVVLLTFIPPLLFTLFFPKGFVLALQYAGIFVIILLALLPGCMVWKERYGPETERSFVESDYKVAGGRFGVLATIVFSLILLAIEVYVL